MKVKNTTYRIVICVLFSLMMHFSLVAQKDPEKVFEDNSKTEIDTINVKISLDTLFKQKSYKKIINILSKKKIEDTLSFNEYILLSRSYGRIRKFVTGAVLTEEMISKALKQRDSANLLEALNLKAEHMIDLNQMEKGVRFCDSITPFFKKRDSSIFMRLCFKCGLFYKYNGQLKKAYNTYKKITQEKYRKLSLFKNNFGIILLDMEKYDEAINLIKESLELSKKEIPAAASLNVNYNNIANIYLRKKEYKKAEKYLDSAYSSLNERSRESSKKTIFSNYFDLYNVQGKTEMTFRFLDSMFRTNEKLLKNRVEEKVLSIEAANRKENTLVKRVIYVGDELKQTKKNILKGTLVLLSFIFILMLLVFFFKYRNIQSSYKKIVINQKLGGIKLNPNNISGSLTVMQNMIDTKNPKTVVFISRFSKLLRSVLEISRKTLIPLTEEVNSLKYYLQVQELEKNSNFKFNINVDSELEFINPFIPPMLIQPYLEHIISQYKDVKEEELKIEVTFTFENQQLSCMIKDNKEKDAYFRKEVMQEIEKTREVLKVFSKKLNMFSDIILNNRNVNNIEGTCININIPYKTEEA